MILQLKPDKTTAKTLPEANQEEMLVRRLQLRAQTENDAFADLPDDNAFWDIFTAGPYLVPVTRRVE